MTVLRLLQPPVTVQIRVAVNMFPQAPIRFVVTVHVPSVPPTGRSNVQGIPHSTVLFGAQTITGGLVFPLKQVAVAEFETVRDNSSVPQAHKVSVEDTHGFAGV